MPGILEESSRNRQRGEKSRKRRLEDRRFVQSVEMMERTLVQDNGQENQLANVDPILFVFGESRDWEIRNISAFFFNKANPNKTAELETSFNAAPQRP